MEFLITFPVLSGVSFKRWEMGNVSSEEDG